MPFVPCAACGTLSFVHSSAPGPYSCRACSAPFGWNEVEPEWSLARSGTAEHEVLELEGSLTGVAVRALEREVALIADDVAVSIDLSGCEDIDASGIELLLRMNVASGRGARFFSVVGASGYVARAIAMVDRVGAIPRTPVLEGAPPARLDSWLRTPQRGSSTRPAT